MLRVVEINARVSQSHSNLMAKVDGMSLIIGGDSVGDINDKFEAAKRLLPFRFEAVTDARASKGKESA